MGWLVCMREPGKDIAGKRLATKRIPITEFHCFMGEQFMPQDIIESNKAVTQQLVKLNSWLGKETARENPVKTTVPPSSSPPQREAPMTLFGLVLGSFIT